MEPIARLAMTFSLWTDDALRSERDKMRAFRAAGEYDAATERNALAMMRDIAHVLSFRRDPTADSAERSHEWGCGVECGTCGFSEQYTSIDVAPDHCEACGTKWMDTD
jgi:hypothetical protein